MGNCCVVVVDFGGQYSHLISRRLRESRICSLLAEPVRLEQIIEEAEDGGLQVSGYILSGSPSSVDDGRRDLELASKILGYGLPVMGICYGHQLIASVLGGDVEGGCSEYGPTTVRVLKDDPVIGDEGEIEVWMSHSDSVIVEPSGFEVIARSSCSVAAMRSGDGRIYGVQWHPEVVHSMRGKELLMSFAEKVCNCGGWRPESMMDLAVKEVRRIVGDGVAVAAVSGGVDSTVAASIATKAIGERLKPLVIDTGLLREGEVKDVEGSLSAIGLDVEVFDISKEIFRRLKGVIDPEEKRRIIGEEYFRALESYALKVGACCIVQGTIYPDVIESGGRAGADRIKTHHNVAALPVDFKLALVEPLRWLYKDEVRSLAKQLDIPESITERQPFPGPGLAVRVMGEVTMEKVELLRRADRIVEEELRSTKEVEGLWQYFAVLLPVKSTGVKGDRRSYGQVVALRAVESVDAMTARPARLSVELLERIAARITSEVPGIVRVVYDVTSKPPATIEWE